MAYYMTLSSTAIPGKTQEAVKGLQELAKHFNENYAGTVEILRGVVGEASRYHWVVEHESLAEWETEKEKFAKDPKCQAHFSTSQEYWENSSSVRFNRS